MGNHWIKKQESNLAGEHFPAVGLIDVPCDFVLDLKSIREARFDLMARICQQYRVAGKTYMPYGQSLVNKEN